MTSLVKFNGDTVIGVPTVMADGSRGVLPAVTLLDSAGAAAPSGSSTSPLNVVSTSSEYETVAAAQTAQVMGTTGATGDRLEGLLVIPASLSPGVVTILDNATSINVFAGGASSLTSLVPFYIYLGVKSVSGPWKVTTGASVSVIATGDFT